jgi:anti-sigma B factor antagonist
MDIKAVDHKGRTILELSGEIDMYSSPDLREELMKLLKKKLPALSIDLQGVSYIDSSGIATFVEGLKCMKSYGGRLQFFRVPASIREIFKFSKLDGVFEMYDNIDDAANS